MQSDGATPTAGATAAGAQAADADTGWTRMRHQPQTPTGPVAGYVATQTLTGSKSATPILEVPQSVSVVTADQMEDRAVVNVGQALDYSAGVVSQPFGTDPRFNSPIIRGFDAANAQYLNSLKLIRTNGFISVEPYGLERIEVLRGPASVLYGQGNPGGLINLVSKRPVWTPFGEVNAEAATFGRYTGSFDFGGPTYPGSDVAYRLTGLVRNGGSQQDFVDDDRYYFAPSLTWRPSAATSLTILANIQYDKSYSPIGVPPEYSLNALKGFRIPRSLYLGEPSFDASSRTLASVGYEFAHTFDSGWTFRQNARYLKLDWNYHNLYFTALDPANPLIANRGSSYNRENINTLTIDNQLQKEFDTGPFKHTLLMGLDVRNHRIDNSTAFGNAPSISILAPLYGMAIPTDITYLANERGTLNQAGLYAQDQIKYGRWLLTLGLRHDWADANSTTYSSFGDTRQDQADKALTGRAGLTYLFDNGLAPYVSYSTSFDPVLGSLPTALGGGAFKPSKGEQYEAGIKYQPLGSQILLTAAIYDLRQTNVTSSELIGGISYTTQAGEVHVKGAELSAVATLSDGLKAIANYTYTDAEITAGDNIGNRPANVPMHAANAWLDYTLQGGPLAGLGFGGGVRFVGNRYNLNTNTLRIPSNTLFDAAVHYERGNFKASLNVNNIADERYVATCGFFGCFYGDGRTVTARLTYRW
ncbi:TonB-dependent siderophore receptor [Chelatococcus reniformis]|uniref:TonB-dependent siderophore receptor n=1 Tax=Chelatococcus reniformis TaxID=1494448 RepID=UPI001FCE3168|nr:TonB-dependent siderophore receptor [Chelatococcus reniformis]